MAREFSIDRAASSASHTRDLGFGIGVIRSSVAGTTSAV
jgi:hypothetical protein